MDKNNGLRFPILPSPFRWHVIKNKDTQVYYVLIEEYVQYNQYKTYLSVEIVEGLGGWPAQILTEKNVRSAVEFAHRSFKDQQAREAGERKFLGVVG